jgi:hypothetical protein
MKVTSLLVFIIILHFGTLFSQSYGELKSKENRKVEVTDRLDSLLNDLIDKNEDLGSRDFSFNSRNSYWREGKIYTKEHDTISGKIKNHIDLYGQTSMALYFKQTKIKRYRADKIIGYESAGRQYFSKRFSNLPPGFIEIIEKGKINLYFTKYNKVSLLTPIAIPSDYFVNEFYLEINGNTEEELIGPIPFSEKHFQTLMDENLKGYPDLVLKIDTHKYTIKQIREIIQLYNNHIDNNEVLNIN